MVTRLLMMCLCPLLAALLSSNPPAFSQILEITPRALALTASPPDIQIACLSSFKSSFNYHLFSEIFLEHFKTVPLSPLTPYSVLVSPLR